MKRILFRSLSLLLCFSFVFAMMSCSGKTNTNTKTSSTANSAATDNSLYKADQSNLAGLCYIAYDSTKWKNVDYKKMLKTMNSLGVKSWRFWCHFNWFMKDPKTLDQEGYKLQKDILKEAEQYHFQIIGMSHNWFTGLSDMEAMPSRDLKEGSAYTKILLNYEESWYTAVKAFPEITYWEIGNEWNNDVFLHPIDYQINNSNIFTTSEKAKITLDMLYYASRGIHRANPKAVTIIGGLCDVGGFSNGRVKNFYEKLYEYIESGDWPSLNPDDYFQVAAWHPYQFDKDVDQRWVDDNLAVYDVIKKHEGHDKKVFLTEMGWSDLHDQSLVSKDADYLTHAYDLVKKNMPFVESMHYFRLLDEKDDTGWGGIKEASFGLFTAPANGFSPKPAAYSYQKIAGGTGNLKEYTTK